MSNNRKKQIKNVLLISVSMLILAKVIIQTKIFNISLFTINQYNTIGTLNHYAINKKNSIEK
jgi:hypothetical protein